MFSAFYKRTMPMKLTAILLVALAIGPSFAQAYTFDDVEVSFWGGEEPGDDVNEAFDPAGEIYTDKRLESLLRELRPESAADAVEGVTADVWRHQAEAEQSDDVTVLALRVTR